MRPGLEERVVRQSTLQPGGCHTQSVLISSNCSQCSVPAEVPLEAAFAEQTACNASAEERGHEYGLVSEVNFGDLNCAVLSITFCTVTC